MVLATSEPLCLDPNPKIGVMSIKKQYHRQLLNTNRIRRHAKKYSQVAINRKRKTDQFTKHVGLHLSEFMSRLRSKPTQFQLKKSGVVNFTLPIKQQIVRPVRPPSQVFPESLCAPPTIEVNIENYVHVFERPKENRDCIPLLLEEYILETDRFDGRVYHIKLSIFHRPSNLEYLGELYVDHNYKVGEKNGEACQFILGTKALAHRYITQFTDIFTEEGRKPVKITHIIPGKDPTVTCTVGLREQNVSMQKKLQQQQAQQAQQQQQQTQSQQQQQQQATQTTSGTQTSTATGSQIQISGGTQSQTPTGTVQHIQTLQQSQQLPPASSPSPNQLTQQQQHLKAIINNNSFNNNNNINSNTNVCNNNNQIVIAGPSIMQPHLYTQQQTSTITTTSTNFTITTSTAATCTFSATTSNTIILSPSPKAISTPTTSLNTPIINNKCDNNNSSISNTNLTKQLNLCSNGSLVLVQQTTDTNTTATANGNQNTNNNNNHSNTILVTTTNVTPTQPNQIQLANRTNLGATVPLLVSSY